MLSRVLKGDIALHDDSMRENTSAVPDYDKSPFKPIDYVMSFFIGFAIGFSVIFIFYKIIPLSLFAAAIVGIVYMLVAAQNAIKKRRFKLRCQFYDLLEAMSVSLRAGSPLFKSLISAREDLALLYAKDSDIIAELEIIIEKFNNTVPLSSSFSDLAERSGLEDIKSFASIYAAIEGKSGRTDDIVRDTQQIISDKMEIEMEIETLMTAAKSEVNIMLFMPLVILGIIGYAGAGFMDAIYTTFGGRIVSTGGLIVFIISVILARKFSNVKL